MRFDLATGSIRTRLGHVRWIGGGSGAGKSTVARHLAARHGLQHYDTDAAMPDHAARVAPGDAPRLQQFLASDMDGRWLRPAPAEMLATFHWFHGEAFGLIVDDLLRLPRDRPIVADGFRLLPHLVEPLLAEPNRAVWLLPTPTFRRAAFDARGWPRAGFLAKTSDPDRAYRNLLARDALFTEHLRAETRRLGLHAIDMPADHAAAQIENRFGL